MENTILIGSALKNKRKELGLSQKEMVGSILSVSYYSKVERNLFDINVNDLTKILALHGIDIVRFFQEVRINKFRKLQFQIEHFWKLNSVYWI